MAKQIKVKAACVVVNVGGQERYLYKGSVLPSGVERKDVTRLKNNGLVVEVEVLEADSPEDVAAAAQKAAADQAAAEKAAADQAAAEKVAADQAAADQAAAGQAAAGQAAKPAGRAAAK